MGIRIPDTIAVWYPDSQDCFNCSSQIKILLAKMFWNQPEVRLQLVNNKESTMGWTDPWKCRASYWSCNNAVNSFKNCISCRLVPIGLMSPTVVPHCENNWKLFIRKINIWNKNKNTLIKNPQKVFYLIYLKVTKGPKESGWCCTLPLMQLSGPK